MSANIWPQPNGTQKVFSVSATSGISCGKFAKDNETQSDIVRPPFDDTNRLRDDNK